LMANMQSFYRITFPGSEPEVRRGSLEPIHVVIKMRGGHKSVTLVTGLERFRIDPEELASALRLRCASSTSGKANAAPLLEVMVQGNHTAELADLLSTQYGIPYSGVGKDGPVSRMVEVVNKLAAKGK
ncbi:translation initiation factor SUI1, partial [Blyttiomyces helicus]